MEYPKKPLQKPYFWDTKNHACIIFILLSPDQGHSLGGK